MRNGTRVLYAYPPRRRNRASWAYLVIVVALLTVCILNGQQLRDCEAKGNSRDVCLRAVNP